MRFKNTAIILTGILALTAVAPLVASAAPVTGIKVSKDHGGIVIQKTGQEVHSVLGGTSPTMDLTVEKGYGHVKIKVKNEGTSNLTWSLQGNGEEYVYKTVGKGDTLTWTSVNSFPNGMPSGKYLIQFRANGNKVEGEAWGTTGRTQETLTNRYYKQGSVLEINPRRFMYSMLPYSVSNKSPADQFEL